MTKITIKSKNNPTPEFGEVLVDIECALSKLNANDRIHIAEAFIALCEEIPVREREILKRIKTEYGETDFP